MTNQTEMTKFSKGGQFFNASIGNTTKFLIGGGKIHMKYNEICSQLEDALENVSNQTLTMPNIRLLFIKPLGQKKLIMFLRHFFLENNAGGRLFIFLFY